MDVAIKDHQTMIGDTVMNAMRSRAVTPAPVVDIQAEQAQVFELLQQGQLNLAFQKVIRENRKLWAIPGLWHVLWKQSAILAFTGMPLPVGKPRQPLHK